MTLPDERWRAVDSAREFLRDLLRTPRVPRAVKDRAQHILRHYPGAYDTCSALSDELKRHQS